MDKHVINNDEGPYELNLNKTGCHEVGHVVGFQHHPRPYGDCMVVWGVFDGHTNYNQHHVDHLNTLLRNRYDWP